MRFSYHHAFVALILLLLLPLTAHAVTLNVPTSAYPTIQAGINAAHDGDTVLVADGTYTGDGNRDIDFMGKNITVKSAHGANETVIDCQTTYHNSHRGFYIHSGETKAVVDGFAIKNGSAPKGGGIFIADSNVTVQNCIFTNNSAGVGGGICVEGGNTIVQGCEVANNSAGGTVTNSNGGGIYISNTTDGVINVDNCNVNGKVVAMCKLQVY